MRHPRIPCNGRKLPQSQCFRTVVRLRQLLLFGSNLDFKRSAAATRSLPLVSTLGLSHGSTIAWDATGGSSHEHFPASRGHDAPFVDPDPAPKDPSHTLLPRSIKHTCVAFDLFASSAGSQMLTAATLPAGISLKTQELYALVFVCRYLDLFVRWVSLWVHLPM